MTKIKGVKNWYCSLEMKEKFGMRPLAAADMQTCRKKTKKAKQKKIPKATFKLRTIRTKTLNSGPLELKRSATTN